MRSPLPDYYRVLQIVPEAEPEVVRASYRALAGRYHPDVAGGSASRMRELNEAWTVLRDPMLRRTYDRRRAIGSIGPAGDEVADGPATTPAPQGGTGSPLDFGRYAGWTIEALSRHDPDYLRWLVRTPIGRRYTAEVEQLLGSRAPVALMERAQSGGRGFGFRRTGQRSR